MSDTPQIGKQGWLDLTVPNAEEVRAFYEKVIGWTNAPVDMGGYNDFCMMPPGAKEGDMPTAGVCHARGGNADIPPVWMVYFVVADLDASLREVESLGGAAISPIKTMSKSRYVIIKDPAGAVCALYQQ